MNHMFSRFQETTAPRTPQWIVRDGGVHSKGRLILFKYYLKEYYLQIVSDGKLKLAPPFPTVTLCHVGSIFDVSSMLNSNL